MSWIDDTLREFGQQLGMSTLEVGQHGAAQLVFQSGAVLTLEPVTRQDIEEVLVYLSRPMGFAAPQLRRRALMNTHFKEASQVHNVQVASHGKGPDSHLIALIRVPARGFTLQSLDQAHEHLSRWHDKVSA